MEKEEILSNTWRFVRFVLIASLVVLVGAAGSFLIWGGFTLHEYSTRLFWGGMGSVVLGGLGIWATLGSYSTMGVTNIFTAAGDAPIASERIAEYMRMNAKRHGFTFRMATVGIICMALSAVIEVLSR